jgi:hypothetical protein
MPHYVSAGCCQDPEHMANRAAPSFLPNMKKDLATCNRVIKEQLHKDGYDNIRCLDPWVALRDVGIEELWGSDPVHIKREHVPKLVESVKIALAKIVPKRKNEDQSMGNLNKKRHVGSAGNAGGNAGSSSAAAGAAAAGAAGAAAPGDPVATTAVVAGGGGKEEVEEDKAIAAAVAAAGAVEAEGPPSPGAGAASTMRGCRAAERADWRRWLHQEEAP